MCSSYYKGAHDLFIQGLVFQSRADLHKSLSTPYGCIIRKPSHPPALWLSPKGPRRTEPISSGSPKKASGGRAGTEGGAALCQASIHLSLHLE